MNFNFKRLFSNCKNKCRNEVVKMNSAYYHENKYLGHIDNYNKTDFPLDMPWPANMSNNVIDGDAFLCFIEKDVEYIMVTSIDGNEHSVSAYKKENGSKIRIGAAYYFIVDNGNIYLENYVVHDEYRRNGIGGNILLSIIVSEYERLLSNKNIYVHAYTGSRIDKQLSQEELEEHYEKYGLVLCDDSSGAYRELPPKEYVRANLMKQINFIKDKLKSVMNNGSPNYIVI